MLIQGVEATLSTLHGGRLTFTQVCVLHPTPEGVANWISVVVAGWNALDTAAEESLVAQLNSTQIQALRDLAPDMGAYVNEV